MRLVVADDSMLLREGLARLLADAGFDVVGKAEDASELLRRVELTRPDVAIVDIKMPPTHTDEGIAAAQEIRRAHPQVGVLVLSQYLESRYAMRLLEEAPDRVGYLLKDRVSDIAVLADALKRIDEGECVIDPTIVSRLLKRPREQGPLDELTEREREVLGLMAEGRSNGAICQTLFLSPKTVEANVRQIFRKLGAAAVARRPPPRAGGARLPPRRGADRSGLALGRRASHDRFEALDAGWGPQHLHVVEDLEGRRRVRKRDPVHLRPHEDVHVGREARRLVERPAANVPHAGVPVLAVDGHLARRTAEDRLRASVVPRDIDRLRLTGEQLDAVRFDQEVDDERAPRLPLAVQAVAAVGEERIGGQPVPNRAAGAAAFDRNAHDLIVVPPSPRRPEPPRC